MFSYANPVRTLGAGYANISDLKVYEPSAAWKRQEERWRLIDALTEGTLGLQRAGKRYLPMEPLESEEAYQARLQRSVCPPYLTRLETMLAGMLTRKPVRLDNVPDPIGEHLFDIDMQGNDLNVYVQQLAHTILRYGHTGVLIDYARGDEGDDTPVTTGSGSRPYWCEYKPRDILGWRTDVIDGTQQLTQLRLMETVTVPYGDYGEEIVQQVRVLTPGAYQLFRQQSSKSRDWELIAEGKTTLDVIPFAVAYCNRVNLLESRPPLEEVAWLNLQAYRCESDQANLLHVAAVPRYNLFGVPAELDELEAGPSTAMALPVDSRAEFAEPAGTSYEARFTQLERIEKQINELGLAAVMGQKMAAETAMAKSIDRSQGDASLMTVALQLQDLIDNCLRFHAAFLGINGGGTSTVNRDFVSQRLESAEVQQLLQLRLNGEITQETLLQRLADGEWFTDDFDVAREIEATAAQQQMKLDQQALALEGQVAALEQTQQPQQDQPQDDTPDPAA